MFGFLKKKEVEKKHLISEEKLSGLLETIIGITKRDFEFIDSIDVTECNVFPKDMLYAYLKLKHKNGDSVDVSVTNYSPYFGADLIDKIKVVVTKTWKFEFEDLLTILRKSSQSIEGFDKYATYTPLVRLTYLGTTYEMPISEVIRFDDKLRESNLDPIYDDVLIVTNKNAWMNEYGRTRDSMNIYGIAKLWIDYNK